MSNFQIPLSCPVGTSIYENTTSNTTAGTVSASAGTVYQVQVDNRNNDVAVWTKLYDNATPVIGTTDPELLVKCRAGKRTTVSYGRLGVGNFGTAITEATVSDSGGTAGTTAPTNAVKVKVWI